MTSPAFRCLPCSISLLASQASEISAPPMTLVPGPAPISLPSNSRAALQAGEVELLPVLHLGADDAGRLQDVVGDAAGAAHLGDVGVAVLDDLRAAMEAGDERLDGVGGVGRRRPRSRPWTCAPPSRIRCRPSAASPSRTPRRWAHAALVDAGEHRPRELQRLVLAGQGERHLPAGHDDPCRRPSAGRGRRTGPCRNWPPRGSRCRRRGSPSPCGCGGPRRCGRRALRFPWRPRRFPPVSVGGCGANSE